MAGIGGLASSEQARRVTDWRRKRRWEMVEMRDCQQQETEGKLQFLMTDTDWTGSLLDSVLSTLLKKWSSGVWGVALFFSHHRCILNSCCNLCVPFCLLSGSYASKTNSVSSHKENPLAISYLLEENLGKTFSDINSTNVFFAQPSKEMEIKMKVNSGTWLNVKAFAQQRKL